MRFGEDRKLTTDRGQTDRQTQGVIMSSAGSGVGKRLV